MPSTTRQTQRRPLLLTISTTSPGLYSVYGPATMIKLFFPQHAQTFNGVGHVFQNTSQVIHCTSHCEQFMRPTQVTEQPTLVFHGLTR